jgi:hypothetical protein
MRIGWGKDPVHNSFSIMAHVDRCPVDMLIPENVRNAFQAVEQMASGGEVQIRSIKVYNERGESAEKLSIYNPGSKLTQRGFIQMSASSNKAVKGSYGQGAKTSSWSINPHGVRYRVNCNGVVVESIVTRIKDSNGEPFYDYIIPYDGNVEIEAEGNQAEYNLSENFFEVTFFGYDFDQKTCENLYGDGTRVDLANTLWLRFYDEYPKTKLTIQKNLLPSRVYSETFRSIGSFFANPSDIMFKKGTCETVPVTTGKFAGATIDYGYDPNTLVGHGLYGSRHSLCAMVFQGEMFNVATYSKNERGCQWYGRICYRFNIHPELAKYFYVFFRFPNNGIVKMDMNRKSLIHCDSARSLVTYDDITSIVRDHMPQWGKDLCMEYTKANPGALSQKIENLMKSFNMQRETRIFEHKKEKEKQKRNRDNPIDPNGTAHSRGNGKREVGQRKSLIGEVPATATYEILYDDAAIDNLIGNDYIAVNQYEERQWNRFFINGNHPSINTLVDQMRLAFPKHFEMDFPVEDWFTDEDKMSVEDRIRKIVIESIIYLIIETVVTSQNQVNIGTYIKDAEPFFLNSMINTAVNSVTRSLFFSIKKQYKDTKQYIHCSGSNKVSNMQNKSISVSKPLIANFWDDQD